MQFLKNEISPRPPLCGSARGKRREEMRGARRLWPRFAGKRAVKRKKH